MSGRKVIAALVLASLATGSPVIAAAQELDPRAYSATPVGTNFALLGYANTSGGVVFDDSSAISDVHATVNAATVSAGHAFDLAGRQASIAIGVPYAWADVSGNVGEDRQSISRSGLGDPRLRLGLMLFGGPAMDAKTFASTPRNPILGASVVVAVPVGEYFPDKLINIGTNRWAFKPELGYSYPLGHWQFDAYAGLWLFAGNSDFFGGHRRTQDPIASFQGHLSYTVRPGLWIAVDATHYSGGTVSVDDVQNAPRQSNLRIGVTASIPVTAVRGMFVKLSYSDGAVTRVGSDFRAFGLAWQYVWLTR